MRLALLTLLLLAAPAPAGIVGTWKNQPRVPATSLSIGADGSYVLYCGSGWSTSNVGPYSPLFPCTDLNMQRGDSVTVDSIWGVRLPITGSVVGLPCANDGTWVDPVGIFRGRYEPGDAYSLAFQDTTYSGWHFQNQGAWRYEPEFIDTAGDTIYERIRVRVVFNVGPPQWAGKEVREWLRK